MANRQKSFFDQDTKVYLPTRPYWKGGWKANDANRRTEQPPRPQAIMAPIAASSQSKSKLKAFQYEQQPAQTDPKADESEKENVQPTSKVGASEIKPTSQPLSQKSTTKDVRECPQTPLGRLPLSQLLASGEDPRQHLNVTPIERVLWGNSSVSSDVPNPGPVQRGRKRAHSSSPASSSQNEASTYFTKEKVADLQALKKALKTPQADPADDLWNRYSSNTGNVEHRSPTAPAGVKLASLLHSSSPQTQVSHIQKDSGGLRRALSCIEWPTSAAKRRRLFHGGNQKSPMMEGSTTDGKTVERSKASRVSLLVDKIHESLAKPAALRQSDSSSEPGRSSPADDRGNVPSSPTENNTSLQKEDQQVIDDVANVLSQTAVAPPKNPTQPLVLSSEDIANLEKATASDFDDDDIDMEMMESIDTTIESIPSNSKELLSKTPRQKDQRDDNSFPLTTANEYKPPEQDHGRQFDPTTTKNNSSCPGNDFTTKASLSPPKKRPPNYDEFDDDDSDVFAADLEDVLAKYDSQAQPDALRRPSSQTIAKPTKAPSTTLPGFRQSAVQGGIEVLSDDDDFGSDSDFERIAVECAEATQIQQLSQPRSSHDRKTPILQRYVIKSIAQSTYEDDDGCMQPEKVLSVQCERTKLRKMVALRQAWIESPCTSESFLHLVGDFDRYGRCVVDNSQNLLILHPDHLISSTVVGDSFTCTRKAVLQDRVKATCEANQSIIYGHMLHEIFQEAMKANRWDDEFMTVTIEKLAIQYLETLFEVQIELAVAVEHLKTRVADLQAWAEIFISARPRPDAVIKDRNGAQLLMSINKLLEVEEKIWSPMYGLKGNVDATVQVSLDDGSNQRTLTVPFELKTGKHQSAAHKAQTSLYTLLLSDRYDIEIACGILYYMQTSEISSIRTIRHELVPMIMQRNELASYVRHRIQLPPMIKRPHICGKCYAQTPCFIHHKMIDNGNGETSGMGEKFDDFVKHLNANHQEFFRKWDDLLTKEEKDIVRFRRELWTMRSLERQKVGRCWGNLIIDAGSFREIQGAPKINRYRYTFIKQRPSPGFKFTESQITLGEPIVISDERGHFALANGYVTNIRKDKIQVTIDRQLHNARKRNKDFDEERHQSFVGVMEVIEDGKTQSTVTPTQPEESVIYRIDKDEFANGMAMVRNNLIRLMEKDVFGVQALRRLIVENVAPTFKPTASAYTITDTSSQARLNVDQKAVIEKVMSAKDYALVLGMPGTGKTTTIAHIIRALVAQGKSVLLTSYTHTAVDNILLKLRDDNIGIFRLGATAKVHPEVQEFADLAGEPIKTVEDLKGCYTRPIVATTCLGINHPIFNQRIFDYCIVDEASQITLPVCLGPIRMARTFILVGDHYQLPPLVQNKEALDGGLDISLFKMLSDNNPESVVNLEHQYRMCEDIMTLSNTLIYSGRLKCGTQAVAARSLRIPNIAGLQVHHHSSRTTLGMSEPCSKICPNPTRGSCWLRDLLDPSTKACFVNTDPLLPQSREVLENGTRITNPVEATLALQLVESFLSTGLQPADIGLITPYRSQLALIKQSLRHYTSSSSGIECYTADKFQGRDKEVVILSLVHSNESQVVSELLKDWRRINVALTRARTKLLILGSKNTLVGNELLKDLVTLMEGKGWCYDLPVGACDGHLWEEDTTTQISSGKGGGSSAAEVLGEREKAPLLKASLSEDKENKRGRKIPAKQGRLDMNALLGKRPVLKDIINDVS